MRIAPRSRFLAGLIGSVWCITGSDVFGQSSPGLQPYTPTRIEWLATQMQADLRQDMSSDDHFLLNIVNSGPDTLLIYVRYLPDVNREAMNMAIDAARKVIAINAKSRGWTGWLKVREDVKIARAKTE